MGVPGLFRWLQKKYKNVTFFTEIKNNKNKILYFDFNCLVHPLIPLEFDQQNVSYFFNDIVKYTDSIIKMVNPTKIYICLDGVAPRAKMNQQRIRRFLSVRNKIEGSFDRNAISPGTQFSIDLSHFLHTYYNSEINKQKVVISDTLEVGEAEHKIMKLIRQNKEEGVEHYIYSADADMLLLAMTVSKKNIKIIRENTLNYNKECKFVLVHMSGMKKAILQDISEDLDDDITQSINWRHLRDFIYLLIFIGDDFVPVIPKLDVYNNGIDNILTVYKEFLEENNGELIINDNFSFNEKNLLIFLKELKCIIDIDSDQSIVHQTTYNSKLTSSYLKTTLWIILYYYRDCPSFSWFYSYHYPPTIEHLIMCLEQQQKVNNKFIKSDPLHYHIQLLLILPKESKNLLPERYHHIFNKKEWYPDEYIIEETGVNFHQIVKLPFINLQELMKEVDKIN